MSDRIRASHILVSHADAQGASTQISRDDAETRIQELKSEVESGVDFGELAKEQSDCPSSARGGDLGEFGRGDMVPEFDGAAFGLEVGELSEVVETDFGFHIIQRTG